MTSHSHSPQLSTTQLGMLEYSH